MTSRNEQTLTYAVLGIFSLLALAPIVGIIFTALQSPDGSAVFGSFDGVHLGNFKTAWEEGHFGTYLKSSVLVAVVVVLGAGFLSILSGYAFGLMRFRGSQVLFYVFLFGLTVPIEAVIVPLYYDFRDLSLTDTYWGLILPQMGVSVAFGTFWMRAFFRGVPRSLVEAARIDGASSWFTLWRVLLPLGAAGRADHDRAAVHVDLERVPAGAGDGVPGGPAHRAARAELLPGAQHLEPDAAGGGRGDRGDPGGDRVRVPAAALHPRHVEWGGQGLAMAEVRFDEVGKTFGEVQAVRELSLDIADGEFMVLVGPSGSGKTTALRMLAGLESVSSGSVFIGDALVNRIAPRERDIAMVFQDYALYPQMTVFDNLAFGLRRRRVAREEIQRRVDEAARVLDIGVLLHRKPGQLSGGQAQRVALGRALVRDPQVFLMDEPLSNLDAKLRTQTRGEIRRIQQEVGTTTVYVTHDQVEAMTMGDRIAVMNHGVLEQVGTPEELYERPANRFVAGFIGSPAMSFLEPSAAAALGLPDAVVGVRPEHARRWREGLLGPLTGTVAFVEALGRETFFGVDVDGSRLVVFEEGRASVDVGSELSFGLVPEGLRYFDADGRATT